MTKFFGVAAFAALAQAAPALSAPGEMAFDCDVPANRVSSVDFESGSSVSISGTVQALELRSGRFLPVAGVRITNENGQNSVGFQLFAESRSAKTLAIRFNNYGADLEPLSLGSVEAQDSVPFAMTFNSEGRGTLTIAGLAHGFESPALTSTKAVVFCSTGQFKFSGLKWDVVAP